MKIFVNNKGNVPVNVAFASVRITTLSVKKKSRNFNRADCSNELT